MSLKACRQESDNCQNIIIQILFIIKLEKQLTFYSQDTNKEIDQPNG